ncbi:HpcH/HpaI aldolase/citrate lyase family protein [Candidatus Poriferisocius sp.]|uniref:HpcH/HpaI aldolase/citrate lyase family protein n=1 Tax=Candidatus Poriferisocius sp. TaxID=3101276 RepID=UPI003B01023B
MLVTRASSNVLKRAIQSAASSVLVDLESSVAPAEIPRARELAAEFFASTEPSCVRGVRLNPIATDQGRDDLQWLAALDAKPEAVLVSHVETAEELEFFAAAMPDTPVAALLESGAAVERSSEIAAANGPVVMLVFGLGDYSRDTGLPMTWEGLLPARTRVAESAHAQGIVASDGPFIDEAGMRDLKSFLERVRTTDYVELRAHLQRLEDLGFGAMSTAFPDHVPLINEQFER